MQKFKNAMKPVLFAILVSPICYLIATFMAFDIQSYFCNSRKHLIKYTEYIYFNDKRAKNKWKEEQFQIVETALKKEINPKIMKRFKKDGFKVILFAEKNLSNDHIYITTGQTNVMVKKVQLAYDNDLSELRNATIHEIGHYVDFKCNYSLHLNHTINKVFYRENKHELESKYSWYSLSDMNEFVAEDFYFMVDNNPDTKETNKIIKQYIHNNFNYKSYGKYGYGINKIKFAFYDCFISPNKTY